MGEFIFVSFIRNSFQLTSEGEACFIDQDLSILYNQGEEFE